MNSWDGTVILFELSPLREKLRVEPGPVGMLGKYSLCVIPSAEASFLEAEGIVWGKDHFSWVGVQQERGLHSAQTAYPEKPVQEAWKK